MRLRRTAGPLGRVFGFECEIGRFSFAFNAGWYVMSACWRGAGCIYVGKWDLWMYSKRIGLDFSVGGGQ